MHKTVKASELKAGDVLCPYSTMHFHYVINEIDEFKSGRIGINVEGTFEAVEPNCPFVIVVA